MPAHPGEDEEVLTLGMERFVLRPIRPEDRTAYAAFIRRMDPSDLRRRFLHADAASRTIDFERLATIDRERDVAFVAVADGEIAGEARLHRYPGASAVELAIIVRSDMQRRGLGRALMRKAIDYCAAQGLEMIAQILPENDAMIGLASRSGMQLEHVPGSDLVIAHMHAAA